MYPIDLSGRTGVVFGIANHRSIAWAIAQILHEAGAELAVAYQNERVRGTVEKLVADWGGDTQTIECDVSDDANVERADTAGRGQIGEDRYHRPLHRLRRPRGPRRGVHEDGARGVPHGPRRERLLAPAHRALRRQDYMTEGGSIVAMTFQAAERVFPGYNVMGTAKAALENAVKQLASDLGEQDVRVNAISAGPLDTLSSRVISKYRDMKRVHAERSPMRRNITSDEVAKTALFLCSDLSSGVTGEIVHVDTGYNIMGI